MDDILIEIGVLSERKEGIEKKIDSFTKNGRQPDDNDYKKMFDLINEWRLVSSNIECLKGVIENYM